MAILVLLSMTFIFIVDFFIDDWRVLLGDVYTLNQENIISVFYILIILALFKIPLDLALSVFIGYHDVYLEKIYKIVNLLVNFMLVLFVVYNDETIIFFALGAGLLDLVVSAFSFVHSIMRYDILKENHINAEVPSVSDLLKKAMSFFQFSLIQVIIWGTGIFFVSHMLSLEDVTIYSLSMKIYVYLFYAFLIINSVIAPMYGRYFSTNSWDDINKVFSFMVLLFPFLGGLIWIGTLYFMSDIIALWTGSDDYYIGSTFVLFMGAFFYFAGYVNSYTTLLYSIGEIKSVLHVRWKEVVLNLLVSFIFVYFLGLVGVAIGMSMSIILISARSLPKHISVVTNDKVNIDFKIQKKHFIFGILPNVIIAFFITTFVEILVIKLIFFTIMTILYIGFSWSILSSKDKKYITSMLQYTKAVNE